MIANELRIGNWVANDKGEYGTVAEISSEGCWIQFSPGTFPTPSDINPIPITEVILLQAGFGPVVWKEFDKFRHFKKDGQKPSECFIIRTSKGKDEIFFSVFNRSECDYTKAQFVTRIQSVHQLQNLYFAITKRELQIDL